MDADSWTDEVFFTDRTFAVPLDHAAPSSLATLSVFVREVVGRGGPDAPTLVFLQGGPGMRSPRMIRNVGSVSWLGRALEDFRVLLVDQRGTGRSFPVTRDPQWQRADFVANFGADSIVRDLEIVRSELEIEKWSVLGQSFGGFCALHYLCVAPERLDRVLIAGGVPPVGRTVAEIYNATFDRMVTKSEQHFERYPVDRARVASVLDRCDARTVFTSSGEAVSRDHFRQIGNVLGSAGGGDKLHALLELDPSSYEFGSLLDDCLPFSSSRPLYAILHEASYADGTATEWAADEVVARRVAPEDTVLLGEHLLRANFSESSGLSPFAGVAEVLAHRPWRKLYDREVLASTSVPVAAVLYEDDPFVDFTYASETISLIPRASWLAHPRNEHDALRVWGEEILTALLMA